jgi:exonuclease SbcD
MNPIALLINDIHASKDNIDDFTVNWEEAVEHAIERNIKHIIIGGDLWQSRAGQTLNVLMAVKRAILLATNAGITLTIAEGNHCKVDQEAIAGYSHIFSEYPLVHVVDVCSVIPLTTKLNLFVMSYFPENGSFIQRYNKIVEIAQRDHSNATNYLYIHEGINGALATASDKELPANIFDVFDMTFVGHYHDRTRIKGTNIYYIGASRQHNFGEDAEKGYTIINDDGSVDFIKNAINKRYATYSVKAADIEDYMKTFKSAADAIKIRIEGTTEELAALQTAREQIQQTIGATKVEFVNVDEAKAVADASNFDVKYNEEGIRDEYLNYCQQKDISDVELGVKYLNKIK